MDTQHARDFSKHEEGPVVLSASNIKKHFSVSSGEFASLFKRGQTKIKAVDDVSLGVRGGFTLGIVGESGCGKTTLSLSLIHI